MTAPTRDAIAAVADDTLVARARTGDAEAFGAIYERYHPRVLGFLLWELHAYRDCRELARDVAHDVMLKAWVALPATDGLMSLEAWLITIARRKVLDLHKRAALIRWQEWDTDLHGHRLGLGADPAAEVVRFETQASVWRTLNRLMPRRRVELVLGALLGLSHAQIATVTGASERATRSSMLRARDDFRRLHQLLEVAP